jgi:VIT1/CCC1 family predicted Fe2+/Mn2+ transporter
MNNLFLSFIIAGLFSITSAIFNLSKWHGLAIIWMLTSLVWMICGAISGYIS